MKLRFALFLIAAQALCMRAGAQNSPARPADCPAAAEVSQPQMLGLWHAEFQGLWQGATVLLENNAHYTESFSGAVNRNGERAKVAGDVDNGEFTMEESADGQRITATWTGDVVEGSCGREIRGSWQAADGSPARGFVLRKQPAR